MKYYKIFLCVLAFLLLVIIFKFSSQPAHVSRNVSFSITQKIIEILPQTKDFTIAERNNIALGLHYTIRKYAHLCLYFFLGISVVSFLSIGKRNLLKPFFLALFICLLYAILDEIHQIFVPGRSCELRDILIDFMGSLLGGLLAGAIIKIKRKYKKNIWTEIKS